MPRYLAMRFARLIPLDILDALLHAWQVMIDLGVRFPATKIQRSGSPALHLAIWSVHGNGVRISGDSLQNDLAKLKDQTQHTAVISAMDQFLGILKSEVVPLLTNAMKSHVPSYFRIQDRIHAYVRHLLADSLARRPNLDLGLFTTVACKLGSSERMHIDWNDPIE
ncbi:hypothetical protein K438DRAFT_1818585 [Mycena galopus ATCC 62051]|nr:hypothetical protein K438DRAFT_1818585 [Mycena galopus ATCC 62051]